MNDSTCSQPDLYASLNLTKLYVQGSLLQTPPHDIPHPKNLVVLANDIFCGPPSSGVWVWSRQQVQVKVRASRDAFLQCGAGKFSWGTRSFPAAVFIQVKAKDEIGLRNLP